MNKLSRKERARLADVKRKEISILILDALAGFFDTAPPGPALENLKYALRETDYFCQSWIKRCPGDAHMIRTEARLIAKQISRDLEGGTDEKN